MVVCREFLQGSCRYGNSCKYEHTLNTKRGDGVSIMRQRTLPEIDVATLVKCVQTDMLNCEKGGQWLLSSYAPFKEKPIFPGFEEQLFEEVRLGFYEAMAAGNVEQYKHLLQETLQSAFQRVKLLQAPNEQIAQTLQQIYNAPVDMGQQASPLLNRPVLAAAPFAAAAPAKVAFAPGLGKASPFAQIATSPAIDITPSAPVGQQPLSLLVGGDAPPSRSIFAGQTAFSGGKLFGMQQQQQMEQPKDSGPGEMIFAKAAKKYQSPPAPVVSTFSVAPAPSVFTYSVPPAPQLTNAARPTKKIPGVKVITDTKLVVGKAAATKSPLPTTATGLFSALDKLSPDVVKQFKAKTFDFGRIPIMPPAVNL